MEKSFAMRSFVFVGFLVTVVAASADLSLLPTLEYPASSHAPGTHYSQIMRPLIRVHFGDQERWRPFLQHDEQSGTDLHAHHRVVRSRLSAQSSQPTSMSEDCEMRSQPGLYLAAPHHHLRGNIPPPSLQVPQARTPVEVTDRFNDQNIVVGKLADSQ